MTDAADLITPAEQAELDRHNNRHSRYVRGCKHCDFEKQYLIPSVVKALSEEENSNGNTTAH